MSSPKKITIREVLSDVLLTAAALVLMFVAWQQWWTNVEADRAYAAQEQTLIDDWGAPTGPDGIPGASTHRDHHKPAVGQQRKVILEGLMYIPRLHSNVWGTPIVYGTSLYDLAHGVGRYQGSAGFGGYGNLAIAGHRTTHGRPFRHLDSLHRGDVVAIRSQNAWFIYALDQLKIVKPEDSWVAAPQPYPGAPTRMLTLSTCNPLHSAKQRLIWWGHFVRSQSDASTPIELRKAT
ncbi:MAG: class E sortase [Actinomycetes bacterium]|jgi:sortase A